MAKERADKPRKERKEKAEKAEKKVSKDKVKKHKKEKKVKREASSDDSDNESTKLEESPAATEEPSVEPSTTAPASELKSNAEEKQAGKKDKSKRKEKKDKKSKKAALEAALGEDASNEATELPMRPVPKDDEDSEGEAPLFTIDTKPTKVNLESVAEKGDAMDEDKDEAKKTQRQKEEHEKYGYNPPPSGLNRQARRRIRMIEEKREKIQKDLGVPVGSLEKADEVQARLDAWVADFDGKAAIRMEKKKRRKEKEAARLKSKSGKVLTGRRLKERKKQLQKMEKKANKKQQRGGLSAVNAEA